MEVNMERSFKDTKLIQIIVGCFLILMGIATCFSPLISLRVVTIAFGIFFTLSGIFSVISYIVAKKRNAPLNGWYLADGAIDILFGINILFDIEGFVAILPFFWALWMFFGGISKIVQGNLYKKIKINHYFLVILIGIADIVLSVGGYLFTPDSEVGNEIFAIIIGGLFILQGVYVMIREFVIQPQVALRMQEAEEMKKQYEQVQRDSLHREDKVCPKCGRVYSKNSDFCTFDGERLVSAHSQDNQTVVDSFAEEIRNQNQYEDENQNHNQEQDISDDPFQYYNGKKVDDEPTQKEEPTKKEHDIMDDYKINYYRRDDDDDDDTPSKQ
jgi:uncharacterized membrane protein HdeD (DUF308 family)